MGSIKHEHNIKINELNKTIDELKQKLKDRTFSIETLKTTQNFLCFILEFFKIMNCSRVFFEYLGPVVHKLDYWGSKPKSSDSAGSSKRGPKRQMSPEEELFIVLARMRCGLLEQDLAVRCQLSTSHISRICITWFDVLHSHLRAVPIWPSQSTIQKTMPNCFKISYPSTRVILDCTELSIEMASSFRTQSATFSSYKHRNTAKGLIGIAPNGAVTFVSEYIQAEQVTKALQNTAVC